MQLIPNAGSWWKMFSMQGIAFATAVQGAILALPARWVNEIVFLDYTWTDLGQIASFIAVLLAGVGRVIQQDNV